MRGTVRNECRPAGRDGRPVPPWRHGVGRLAIAGLIATMCMGGGVAWAQEFGDEETAYLKQRTFLIPIEVAGEEGNSIRELRLFVSVDKGSTWTQIARVQPTQPNFRFRAKVDGEYWFSLALVDANGNMDPPEVKMQSPGLKVVVDTTAPIIQLRAIDRSQEEAAVAWKIIDSHPVDLGSLKIEVRDKREGQWRELTPDAALEGEIRWKADPTQSFVVRATIEDRAGNQGLGETEVLGTAPVTAVAATEPLPAASVPSIAETGFPIPAPPNVTAPAPEPRFIPKAAPPQPQQPDVKPTDSVAGGGKVVPFDQMRPDLPADTIDQPPGPIPAASLGEKTFPAAQGIPVYEREPVASTATASVVRPASHEVKKEPMPEPVRVPLIGTTRFAVDYTLRGVGPAGVGKVEMYYTKDNGASWTLLGEDADRMPPFEVELPGEGRYGLAVVVTSPAGRGQKPPQSGDMPKVQVEVDVTAPEAELYRPIPDPATDGQTLLISWSAHDAHLPDRPVGLYFAEAPTGPWYRIAVGLPAEGQYSWTVPPRTPHQVYLKLIAVDMTKNIAEATTDEPVLVDLSQPEAEVIGIAVLPSGRE